MYSTPPTHDSHSVRCRYRRPPAARQTTPPPFSPANRAVGAAKNFGGKSFRHSKRFCTSLFVIINGLFGEPSRNVPCGCRTLPETASSWLLATHFLWIQEKKGRGKKITFCGLHKQVKSFKPELLLSSVDNALFLQGKR